MSEALERLHPAPSPAPTPASLAPLRTPALAACQPPNPVVAGTWTLHKPATW